MGKRYWDDEIESLERKDIEELQERLLKEHLSFAYENSEYYKEAFKKHGVAPEDLEKLEDINKFPFINKSILRERQVLKPLLGDITSVPEDEVVFVSASSGSTGVPTLSPFTQKDFIDFQDVQSRLFWSSGMRSTDRYVHALNFTLFVGGPDVIGAQNLGALCIWAGTVPSERLLFILKEFQPTVIWTTPSYAWYLGETAIKNGIDPAKDLAINKIIVAGESGGSIEATRKAIEKLWHAKVYDFYGISDIFGACAGMCSERDGLHLAEDNILVEVIDPKTLEQVKDGETGELVFTTLKKRARPLIRFRTGDIGFINKNKCKCGRTHTRIYITGRIDDMLIISGVNIFPSDIEYVIRNIEGLSGEYRIIAFTENFATKYRLEIEKQKENATLNSELENIISNKIKVRIGVKPSSIKILDEGELPRSTHKAKRLFDERKKS